MKLNKRKVELLMAQKGMSQTTLSKLSTVSAQTISYVINGKKCKPITAAKIAMGLQVDVNDIIE